MKTFGGFEIVKTYTDNIRHTTTIGHAYRCIKCGVIWTKRSDAIKHQQTCTERNK